MNFIHVCILMIMVCALSAESVNILPLGDSITQGGKANRKEYTYRYPLFCMLKDAKVDFNFIGSMKKGLHPQAQWPDYKGEAFDMDHEGHYGWKTAKVWENLEKWSKKWGAKPDIAIIHLGTNDQGAADHVKEVKEPMVKIINFLRKQNPKVIILIGQLNLNSKGAKMIRPLFDQIGKDMSTKESPIHIVHGYKGCNENPNHKEPHTFDWAHPNPAGQKKMAEDWFAVLKPYLVKE